MYKFRVLGELLVNLNSFTKSFFLLIFSLMENKHSTAFNTFTWGLLGTISSGLIYFVANILLTEIPNIKAEIKVIKSKSEFTNEYLYRIDKRIERVDERIEKIYDNLIKGK